MFAYIYILIRRSKQFFYTLRAKRKVASYGKDLRVNGKTSLSARTYLGNNNNFNGMIIQGEGKVVIGDNFHSGIECMMITHNHDYDMGKAIPYDNTFIHKDIIIKDNVWLGSRVILLGGITIGEGAIVQAGSVVVSDVPDCAIVGGHPAKVFKYRDRDHYYELKEKGLFF